MVIIAELASFILSWALNTKIFIRTQSYDSELDAEHTCTLTHPVAQIHMKLKHRSHCTSSNMVTYTTPHDMAEKSKTALFLNLKRKIYKNICLKGKSVNAVLAGLKCFYETCTVLVFCALMLPFPIIPHSIFSCSVPAVVIFFIIYGFF